MFPCSLIHLMEVGKKCDECLLGVLSNHECERKSQTEPIMACMKYFYRLDKEVSQEALVSYLCSYLS